MSRAPASVAMVEPGAFRPNALSTWRWRAGTSSGLTLTSMMAWLVAVRAIRISSITDYGLVSALPLTYYLALVCLVAAFVLEVSRPAPSWPRLSVQVVLLVLILHGTIPLVLPEPQYPWVYKHFGVVSYINLHGTVDDRIDIYQNWPGFFAAAAWFDRMAGVDVPIRYAAWAPVYFNLVAALAVWIAARGLGMSVAVRWVAAALFVAANWVGQDYFAPQALGFTLSLLALTGVITRLRSAGRAGWVARCEGLAQRLLRAPGPLARGSDPSRSGSHSPASMVAITLLLFGVTVFTHQLSPYMVIAATTGLVLANVIRPRWLLGAMLAMALGYLALHFHAVQSRDLVSFNPFHNAHNASVTFDQGTEGRLFGAHASQALSLLMWLGAALAVLARWRRGRSSAVLAALTFSPITLLLGEAYGGEAIYRIFLFSLPWAALLLGDLVVPRTTWSVRRTTGLGVLLGVVAALYLPAYYGLEATTLVRPDEVQASAYFYEHAPAHSVLAMVDGRAFPTRLAGNYDVFSTRTAVEAPSLVSDRKFQHRDFDSSDVPAVEAWLRGWSDQGRAPAYLAISTSMKADVYEYSILPPSSLPDLDQALSDSPDWTVFYRNRDVVIYHLLSGASS